MPNINAPLVPLAVEPLPMKTLPLLPPLPVPVLSVMTPLLPAAPALAVSMTKAPEEEAAL